MRLRASLLALITAFACGCTQAPESAPSPLPALPVGPLPEPLPRIAAHVNDATIYSVHVRLLAQQALAKAAPAGRKPAADPSPSPDPETARAYREALRRLVLRELLFEEAVDRGITADARGVERAYDEVRRGYSDEGSWLAYLAGQGFDEQRFRNELRINHSVDALLHQVFAALPQVTDAEALAYYNQNPAKFDVGDRMRVSQILRRVKPEMGATARKSQRAEAERVLARVNAGEDFEQLARSVSEDTASAQRGGELDPFARGVMEPEFEAAAFALEPGQTSGVIETSVGFHVIKALEKLPARKLGFEETRDELKAHLQKQREAQSREQLEQRLWSTARIELFL